MAIMLLYLYLPEQYQTPETNNLSKKTGVTEEGTFYNDPVKRKEKARKFLLY